MSDDKKSSIWGNALGGIAAIASIPFGVAKGAYDSINGESFEQGFEGVVEGTFAAVKEFGDEHAGPITSGVVGAVATVVLTAMTGGKHKG